MNVEIVTSELPEHTQPGNLLAYGTRNAHRLVVVARPSRDDRVVPLLRDLVSAGRDIPPESIPRNEAMLARTVTARLAGIPIRQILVASSENLSPSDVDLLLALSRRTHTNLTLAYGIDTGERLREHTQRHGALDIPWDDLELSTPEVPEHRASIRPFPQRVPASDFPLFLHSSSTLLDVDDHTLVEATYWTAYDATLRAGITSTEQAAEHLQRMLAPVTSSAEATTITRGAQAAHLINGYLMKIDMHALRLHVDEGSHRRLGPDHLQQHGSLMQTWQAAAVVLLDAGYDIEAALELDIANLADDGTPANPPAPLLDESLPWLRVQRAYRQLQGAKPTDPLLGINSRDISAAKRAAAALGIPIDLRRNPQRKADRWQHRTGILLQELT